MKCFTAVLFFAAVAALFGSSSGAEVVPEDCAKFKECNADGCLIKSCDPGKEFNPEVGACDIPLKFRSDCKKLL